MSCIRSQCHHGSCTRSQCHHESCTRSQCHHGSWSETEPAWVYRISAFSDRRLHFGWLNLHEPVLHSRRAILSLAASSLMDGSEKPSAYDDGFCDNMTVGFGNDKRLNHESLDVLANVEKIVNDISVALLVGRGGEELQENTTAKFCVRHEFGFLPNLAHRIRGLVKYGASLPPSGQNQFLKLQFVLRNHTKVQIV